MLWFDNKNCTFSQVVFRLGLQKNIKVKWVCISVVFTIINGTLHECLGIRNFSFSCWNIFQHSKRNSLSPPDHVISAVYVLAGTCQCLGLHWFLPNIPSLAKRRTLTSLHLNQNHNPNFWSVPIHSLLETGLLNSLPSGKTKEILCLCMWWQDLYFTQESIDKRWIPDLKWYLLKHGFKTETTLCKPKNE